MRIVAILLMLILSSVSFAAEPETTVSIDGTVISGQPVKFSVYIFNGGDSAAKVLLPDYLTCLLVSETQSTELIANGLLPVSQAAIEVEQGRFIKRQYSLDMPERFEGYVRMKIKELAVSEVTFKVISPSPDLEILSQSEEPDANKVKISIDGLFSLYQPYHVNFAAYEPVYFLVGVNPEESKFQISFKYQVFKAENSIAVNHPWVTGFNLGYTQTSFWDLKSPSAPFEDTSYKPELFYMSSNIGMRPDWLNGFLFQTGIRHESNGRGGVSSRSTNTAYIRPIFVFVREDNYGLLVAPRFRAYFKNSDIYNPDLPDYRGNFDVDIKIGKTDSLVLSSNIGLARKGASFQLDLTYPLNHYIFKDLNLFLQVQYVNSLAENLIDYQKRTHALRIGFALIR